MDIMNIVSSVNSGTQFTDSLGTESTGVDGISFSQMLSALNGGTTMDTATGLSGTAADPTDLTALTWRDMQALLGVSGYSTPVDTQLEGTDPTQALMEMLEILTGETQGLTLETLTPEKAQQLLDLVAKLQKDLEEEVAENGQLMAMEQLMSILGQSTDDATNPLAGLQDLSGGNVNVVQEVFLNSAPGEVLSTLTGIPAETFTALAATNGDTATFAQQVQEASTENPVPVVQQAQSEAVDAPKNAANAGETAQTAPQETPQVGSDAAIKPQDAQQEVQAARNVQTAKDGLEGTARLELGETDSTAKASSAASTDSPAKATQETQAPERKTIEIDRLQSEVDSGVHMQNTAYATQAPSTTQTAYELQTEEMAQSVTTQVEQGIVKGLQNGEEMFTVRLNPEGLGDVVVRLTKTQSGEMLLNLVARNPETQKMMAAQVEALQTALQPLNVQVEAVLTEQQDLMMNYQQAFAGQQQPGNWTTGAQHTAHPGVEEAEGQALSEPMPQVEGSSALDTYV